MADTTGFLVHIHFPLIPYLQNPNHVYKRKHIKLEETVVGAKAALREITELNGCIRKKRSQINH